MRSTRLPSVAASGVGPDVCPLVSLDILLLLLLWQASVGPQTTLGIRIFQDVFDELFKLVIAVEAAAQIRQPVSFLQELPEGLNLLRHILRFKIFQFGKA